MVIFQNDHVSTHWRIARNFDWDGPKLEKKLWLFWWRFLVT